MAAKIRTSRLVAPPSSDVAQEVLRPFVKGEQMQSVDECLESD
jgi:hypothetical protein